MVALWAAIAIGVVSLVGIAFEPRRVRSIGYRLREDDLLFRRGIMFQRLVAVPYGRMQLVDITRGPSPARSASPTSSSSPPPRRPP